MHFITGGSHSELLLAIIRRTLALLSATALICSIRTRRDAWRGQQAG